MKIEFFSKKEAKELVGCLVKSKPGLESIPEGIGGIVTRIIKAGQDQWTVRVEWQLSRKCSEYFAMFGEYSFNFRWPSKIVTHEFAKDNLESFAGIVHSRNR